MIRALLLAALVACSSSAPAAKPVTPPAAKPKSARANTTPRAELPPALAPQLPKHGYYAAGGGLVSSAWRVVVDTDASTIASGASKRENASSTGKLDHESTAPLPADARAALAALAADTWREAPPTAPPQPTADYDEVLVILDGDDAFFLEGFGPIRRPVAAKLVAELRARAGI